MKLPLDLPKGKDLRGDLAAGLTNGLVQIPAAEGRFLEEEPPERLPDDEVTIIDNYGSVFSADTEAINAELPEVVGARHAVLVVRLRGRGELGSSAIGLLRRWTEQLKNGDGALLLAGVGARMGDQLVRTGLADLIGPHNIFAAHSLGYRSTEEALAAGLLRLRRASGTQTPREGT